MQTAQLSIFNPAFAGYAAKHLREASDDLQRVFDNLLETAGGDDPDANGYDRLRATRILYDRGFGKVNKNIPHSPRPAPKSDQSSEPEKPLESEESTIRAAPNPLALLHALHRQTRDSPTILKQTPCTGTI